MCAHAAIPTATQAPSRNRASTQACPVTIFMPRQSGFWSAKPGMIPAPSRSHDLEGAVTWPDGWLVIADRCLAGITLSSRNDIEKLMCLRPPCTVRVSLEHGEDPRRGQGQQQEQCRCDHIDAYVVPGRSGCELARLQQIRKRSEHADERRILGRVTDAGSASRAAA